MANALKKITTAAKAFRKKHPKTSWKSAVKKAGAAYRAGKLKPKRKAAVKKRVVRKKAVRKKVAVRKAAPRKRRRVAKVAAVSGVRRRRRAAPKKSAPRRRVSGMSKTNKLLLVGGLAVGALLLFKGMNQPQTVYVPTGDTVRDNKAQNILSYVAAAGASAAMIADIVAKLRSSSNAQVDQLYDSYQAGANPFGSVAGLNY